MKSWLKGGLILGTIQLIFYFSFIFLIAPNYHSVFPILQIFALLPAAIIILNLTNSPIVALISLIIINFIFYFAIGALIGWIIEKIKESKQ